MYGAERPRRRGSHSDRVEESRRECDGEDVDDADRDPRVDPRVVSGEVSARVDLQTRVFVSNLKKCEKTFHSIIYSFSEKFYF